jgi:hypothetical protein
MAGRGDNRESGRRARGGALRARILAAVSFALLASPPAEAHAQPSPVAVVAPGEAAVTGFSGAPPPPQIAPGDDPAALTFIDANGPSLRIIDLRHMGGPASAQLVGAPKPFTFAASEIGQVFGVALDDATPPNVYVAASSAYGLPIVAPGSDGSLRHVRSGASNAAFMPGLWGPKGGPGSIFRIDGATARASLFATVTTGGRPNSGAALGGLAFDPQSKSFFVADRETGLIHRLAMDGADLGSFDHGVAGRAAQGLPPAPWAVRQPVDVTSPQFDSADPATWSLADPKRRVFGLAVHERRLYYAVADSLQIWSVGLKPDGAFGDDAIIELAAPPAAGPTEISKIAFDDQRRMLLAERPAPTGAFDFEALAQPAIGRVLRYAIVGTAAGRRVWQEEPDEYALGFPADYRNGNGGVDAGPNYDRNGGDRGLMRRLRLDVRRRPAPIAGRGPRGSPHEVGASAGERPSGRRRVAEPAAQRAAGRELFRQLPRRASGRRGARAYGRHRHPSRLREGFACGPRVASSAARIRPAAGRAAAGSSQPASPPRPGRAAAPAPSQAADGPQPAAAPAGVVPAERGAAHP